MHSDGRRAMSGAARQVLLQVDWQACQGRGLCHELLPELIGLDDWGYPLVSHTVPAGLLAQAGRAVRSCPQLALALVVAAPDARHRAGGPPPA